MTVIKVALFTYLKNAKPTDRTEEIIKDVYDSLLYKRIVAEWKDDCILLTFIFITDGPPYMKAQNCHFG